ncbi:enoyl-CoA hydratase-related protein [Microbulbifer taiwanensis]|uniref:enoyl-CoA hydratase-related protein n=1 Tax=Microbulbifer taiwanensis TaxID=986746 RepID=UPI0036090894
MTLLQANGEMDAGDIWGSVSFPLRAAGKAGHYRREVTAAAALLVKRAIASMQDPAFRPRPLLPEKAPGRLLPPMTQADRAIDWRRDATDTVIAKLRAADSAPGVCEEIAGKTVFLYGVRRETALSGDAGAFIASSNGALCRATADGAVWLLQARRKGGIKLPAARVLVPLLDKALPELEQIAEPVRDIRVERRGDVAYLYFEFPGGAMDSLQCLRLLRHYRELQASDAKVLVLMGGEDFWSNGLHLHVIEAAANPAQESWENICAIDDLVEAIVNTPRQITVAALRANAGAGGAMMALACDHVVVREGVVLSPHYRTMGLYGSEYWTYLLPRRVGQKVAASLTEKCLPLLAAEALQTGYADEVFDEDWHIFGRELEQFCEEIARSRRFERHLKAKRDLRAADEKRKPLQQYRDEELEKMRATFFDAESEYHRARRHFVYKIPAKETPAHLRRQRRKVRFWQRPVFSQPFS